MTLANSRLWDAINGFFFLFAHMMEKLYKNSTQLELLREFLNLQKDMIVLMLSMLEGRLRIIYRVFYEFRTTCVFPLKFTLISIFNSDQWNSI